MEKYEIGRKLGGGEYGVIHEVTNRNTSEVFAMKCILLRNIRFRDIDEYVEREILNHRGLQHPNIIQLKEVVLDDKKLGIVMELADGGELHGDIHVAGEYDEAKARKMFQQLIAGLRYIHSKGIYHQDLKPQNILLTSKGELKICNFGLSKSSKIHSRAKTRVGTPRYWAPEVALLKNQSSEVYYDGKLADIWSCGMILYEMLPGSSYPDPDNLIQCINSLHVSEGCKDLLRQMLVADPNNRITTEGTMKHPWYLMDVPPYLTAEAQAAFCNEQKVTLPCQTDEDIKKIIAQIRKPS